MRHETPAALLCTASALRKRQRRAVGGGGSSLGGVHRLCAPLSGRARRLITRRPRLLPRGPPATPPDLITHSPVHRTPVRLELAGADRKRGNNCASDLTAALSESHQAFNHSHSCRKGSEGSLLHVPINLTARHGQARNKLEDTIHWNFLLTEPS